MRSNRVPQRRTILQLEVLETRNLLSAAPALTVLAQSRGLFDQQPGAVFRQNAQDVEVPVARPVGRDLLLEHQSHRLSIAPMMDWTEW